MRWPNPPGCYNHVIVIAHSPYCFNDFTFIVGNDLDSFQLNAQFETVLGYEN